MDERAALLRAVCDAPDDDAPRLVFADWLDERRKPPLAVRAEFIRVQCEAARLTAGDPNRAALEARAAEILAPRERQWVEQLPAPPGIVWMIGLNALLSYSTFDRGFPCLLRANTADDLAQHADAVFATSPVRHLMIEGVVNADHLGQLPGLRHLRTLRVGRLTETAAKYLLESTGCDGLQRLQASLSGLRWLQRTRLQMKFADRLVAEG